MITEWNSGLHWIANKIGITQKRQLQRNVFATAFFCVILRSRKFGEVEKYLLHECGIKEETKDI